MGFFLISRAKDLRPMLGPDMPASKAPVRPDMAPRHQDDVRLGKAGPRQPNSGNNSEGYQPRPGIYDQTGTQRAFRSECNASLEGPSNTSKLCPQPLHDYLCGNNCVAPEEENPGPAGDLPDRAKAPGGT